MDDSGEPISRWGEFGLIERLAAILGPQNAVTGIGDDAAVMEVDGNNCLLATIDMHVENVHFRRQHIAAFELGRRVVAVNLSDIAAMGGKPTVALISLALPPQLPMAFLEELYRGIREEADAYGVAIVGGNIASTEGPLAIDVAMLGEAPCKEVVRRTGARVGDVLAVSGPLGAAAAALALREQFGGPPRGYAWEWVWTAQVPEPRVRLGRRLAQSGCVSAMLDVSDGLAADLHHLCTASKLGARVEAALIPVDGRAIATAGLLDLDAASLALSGGEDYELLVTVPAARWSDLVRELSDDDLIRIGSIVPASEGVAVISADGSSHDLTPDGWRHF